MDKEDFDETIYIIISLVGIVVAGIIITIFSVSFGNAMYGDIGMFFGMIGGLLISFIIGRFIFKSVNNEIEKNTKLQEKKSRQDFLEKNRKEKEEHERKEQENKYANLTDQQREYYEVWDKWEKNRALFENLDNTEFDSKYSIEELKQLLKDIRRKNYYNLPLNKREYVEAWDKWEIDNKNSIEELKELLKVERRKEKEGQQKKEAERKNEEARRQQKVARLIAERERQKALDKALKQSKIANYKKQFEKLNSSQIENIIYSETDINEKEYKETALGLLSPQKQYHVKRIRNQRLEALEEEARRQEAILEAQRKKEERLRKERERKTQELLAEARRKEAAELAERNRLNAINEQKKGEAEAILRYLNDNGVRCFYHFTDRKNLVSIKKHGGLLSWWYCKQNDITIPNAGGDSDSRRLDCKYNLQNYVRVSFCDDHPMAFRCYQEGGDLVLLKISTEVATFKDTIFSDMNATATGHSKGLDYEALLTIDISATKEHYLRKDDPNFKPHQAEVMINTFIPIRYILNIDNPQTMIFG